MVRGLIPLTTTRTSDSMSAPSSASAPRPGAADTLFSMEWIEEQTTLLHVEVVWWPSADINPDVPELARRAAPDVVRCDPSGHEAVPHEVGWRGQVGVCREPADVRPRPVETWTGTTRCEQHSQVAEGGAPPVAGRCPAGFGRAATSSCSTRTRVEPSSVNVTVVPPQLNLSRRIGSTSMMRPRPSSGVGTRGGVLAPDFEAAGVDIDVGRPSSGVPAAPLLVPGLWTRVWITRRRFRLRGTGSHEWLRQSVVDHSSISRYSLSKKTSFSCRLTGSLVCRYSS